MNRGIVPLLHSQLSAPDRSRYFSYTAISIAFTHGERRSAPTDPPPPILRSKLSSFRSCVISSRSCSSKTNRITGSGRSGREL